MDSDFERELRKLKSEIFDIKQDIKNLRGLIIEVQNFLDEIQSNSQRRRKARNEQTD